MLEMVTFDRGWDREILKARLNEDGFVCLTNVLSVDLLERARTSAEEICQRHGLLRRRPDGLECTDLSPELLDPLRRRAILDWVQTPEYRKVVGDSQLKSLLCSILEDRVVPHPSPIAALGRFVPPRRWVREMPAHQDTYYLNGPKNFLSAWIPCMDCPRDLGALAVLKGSHRLRYEQTTRDGLAVEDLEGWQTRDFACGDVVLFFGNTIHRPLPNLTLGTMRMVMDFRFCRATDVLAFLDQAHHVV